MTIRTMADEGREPRERIKCGCGRVRPAYAMVDVRALPEGIRGSREFVCDGCKTDLWRRREPAMRGRAEFAEAMGEPPDLVERLRARERGR